MVATSKAHAFTPQSSKQLLTTSVLSMALFLGLASGSKYESSSSGLQAPLVENLVTSPKLKDSLNTTFVINSTNEYNLTLYGNAFIKGMDANDILSPNTSNCFNDWLWFYYHELPTTQIKFYYGSFDDILFNTTELIANMSVDMMVCTSMSQDFYNFYEEQVTLFTTMSSYGLAMFQHVVANIITLSMIYQNILTDTTVTYNTTDVWYQMGKVFQILITVPPIINANYRSVEDQTYLTQDDVSTNDTVIDTNSTDNSPTFTSKLTPEAQTLLTFDGFMNFTIGIINGTQMYDIDSLVICRTTIDESWLNESTTAWNDIIANDWFGALFNIEDVLYNTDTVAHSCYAGVEQMSLEYYTNWQNNDTASGASILVNTAYNFGEIYDDLEALYFFFIETPYSPGTTPSEAGEMIGEIILLMNTPPVPLETGEEETSSNVMLMQIMSKIMTSYLKTMF